MKTVRVTESQLEPRRWFTLNVDQISYIWFDTLGANSARPGRVVMTSGHCFNVSRTHYDNVRVAMGISGMTER